MAFPPNAARVDPGRTGATSPEEASSAESARQDRVLVAIQASRRPQNAPKPLGVFIHTNTVTGILNEHDEDVATTKLPSALLGAPTATAVSTPPVGVH